MLEYLNISMKTGALNLIASYSINWFLKDDVAVGSAFLFFLLYWISTFTRTLLRD